MKDIKDYLHLYFGQDCVEIFNGVPQRKTYKIAESQIAFTRNAIREYRPILRPLSDMTEEEKLEIFQVGESDWRQRHLEFTAEQFITLLSKGFDLFGLIEAGLAIDKTKQK